MNRRDWLTGWLALLAAAGSNAAEPKAEEETKPPAEEEEHEEPPKEPFSLFVPTPERAVIRMLEMARVGPRDLVLDLGSGDGRIPILAARRFGARGRGVDINPSLVKESAAEAARQGVNGRVRFEQGDVMETDARSATVVSMYLFPALINRLKPRLLEQLRPGARIVIYDYTMAEWPAEETLTTYVPERFLGRGGDVAIRVWVMPANFSGTWRGEVQGPERLPFDLSIKQSYQRVDGGGRMNGKSSDLYTSHVRGSQIEFLLEPERGFRYEFSGRLEGDVMRGRVLLERGGKKSSQAWSARRMGFPQDIFRPA